MMFIWTHVLQFWEATNMRFQVQTWSGHTGELQKELVTKIAQLQGRVFVTDAYVDKL